MKIKKILLMILLILIIAGIIVLIVRQPKKTSKDVNKLNIVVTTFSAYDFARQIVGNNENVVITYLLGPGVEAHSYEPSTSDIIEIQEADVFIYIGGEYERWVEKTLQSIDTSNIDKLCLLDIANLQEEKEIDGAASEEHHEESDEIEYDQHIWTSTKNAILMLNSISDLICKEDSKNAEYYKNNARNYQKQIEDVQARIQEIVDNRARDRLVFGDKMPMQYFISEFGLEVSAAFNGCSTETEPSSSTLTYLIDLIKKEKIPVVLYIELSNGKTAKTIADATEATMLQIQSLHNVSKDDFYNGETYVSLMTRNFDVLKKALQ